MFWQNLYLNNKQNEFRWESQFLIKEGYDFFDFLIKTKNKKLIKNIKKLLMYNGESIFVPCIKLNTKNEEEKTVKESTYNLMVFLNVLDEEISENENIGRDIFDNIVSSIFPMIVKIYLFFLDNPNISKNSELIKNLKSLFDILYKEQNKIQNKISEQDTQKKMKKNEKLKSLENLLIKESKRILDIYN